MDVALEVKDGTVGGAVPKVGAGVDDVDDDVPNGFAAVEPSMLLLLASVFTSDWNGMNPVVSIG